jgi:nitroreductase
LNGLALAPGEALRKTMTLTITARVLSTFCGETVRCWPLCARQYPTAAWTFRWVAAGIKRATLYHQLVSRRQTVEFSELISKRYSVRAYKPDPVENEKLEQVLQAARLAPTAANRQPFQLIVIPTQGREAELRRIYDREWFTQAPIVICACAVPAQGWVRGSDGKNYTLVDVAIAVDHLILAATDLGLGTCWIAAFDPLAARQVLGLPDGVEPIVLTPLGYPADQPRPKERKPLSDLVRDGGW